MSNISSLLVQDGHCTTPLEILSNWLAPWLFDIVKLGYSQYDESHGYSHVVKVLELLKRLDDIHPIEWIAAAVHDIVDEKYSDSWSISADELRERVALHTSAEIADIVMNIITNMSWSDEMKGLNSKLEVGEEMRQRVQFADWMTSVGREGLVKSFHYNTAHGHPDPAQAVVDLFAVRLSKYVEHTYATEQMQQIARELHTEMLGPDGAPPTAEFVRSLI